MSLVSEFLPTIGALVELEQRNTDSGLTDAERDEWILLTRRLFGFDQHERRRFFRLHARLVAIVSTDEEPVRAVVSQLSAGGLGLVSKDLGHLDIGDAVSIRFDEESRALAGHQASGRVAWRDESRDAIGLEFDDIEATTRTAVIEFLGDHLNTLLYRAEDAFKLFFQHSLDLAALLEGDGRIITISETGAATFGATADGLSGKNFASLVVDGDAAAFTDACERAQLGGRTRMRLELVDGGGARVAADLAITPFRIEDLRLGCFLAGHDDRDRKLAEDNVQRLERRLIMSDAMATLGYISAGVAHDVNNPLTFVLMHADALDELSKRVIDEREPDTLLADLAVDLPEIAHDITHGAHRIADLIAELSRFTSFATNDTQVGDLPNVIASVTVMVRNLINHRARLVQKHEPTVGSVALSSGRLTQILLNLLSNAAQAFVDSDTERNVIRLETSLDGPNVVIEVIDNGPGIPEAKREELLEPFKTTRSESGGTGLGLTIAKDCAESAGGSLAIGDAEGGGTRITVTLPAADTPEPGLAAKRTAARISIGRAPRVLILDDEPAILNAYERALKSQFEVVTTTSATKALLLTSVQDYDAIVCDVMIPGVSGLDFYDKLEADSPDLTQRLIFVTGGTMSSAERGRLKALGNRVILKPVSARKLADAVWDLLASCYDEQPTAE